MKYKIIFAGTAEADLENIYKYIAFALLAPETSAKQLDRIKKIIYSLNEMPERYRKYEKEPWHSRGLCRMPADNYIVFYIPYADEKVVKVIRVLYSRSNIDKILKNTQVPSYINEE